MKNNKEVKEVKKLTAKQEVFCREYLLEYNATKAAIKAGYSVKAAGPIGSRLLTYANIQSEIKKLQSNLSETAGISALRVLNELKAIAFSNASDFREGWLTLKQFNSLTEEQKSSISEISTKKESRIQKSSSPEGEDIVIEEELVRIRLYDKQKALDSISKMLGYDAPQKVDVTSMGQKLENKTVIQWGNQEIEI